MKMEKVIIETAVNTGKEWQGKPIINIKLRDGRVGSCMDLKILELIGKESELDIKPGKEYQGVQQYYFNIPNANGKKGFPPKDYTFEKKRVAIEQSVALVVSGKVTMDKMVECRDKFYEYLNSK